MRLPSFSAFLVIATLGSGVAKPAPALTNISGNVESILVQRLSDGKVVYSSGPEKALTPASVTKIITSAALLHYFGPSHPFKTHFSPTRIRRAE